MPLLERHEVAMKLYLTTDIDIGEAAIAEMTIWEKGLVTAT
jgi:hypothetical protein